MSSLGFCELCEEDKDRDELILTDDGELCFECSPLIDVDEEPFIKVHHDF